LGGFAQGTDRTTFPVTVPRAARVSHGGFANGCEYSHGRTVNRLTLEGDLAQRADSFGTASANTVFIRDHGEWTRGGKLRRGARRAVRFAFSNMKLRGQRGGTSRSGSHRCWCPRVISLSSQTKSGLACLPDDASRPARTHGRYTVARAGMLVQMEMVAVLRWIQLPERRFTEPMGAAIRVRV